MTHSDLTVRPATGDDLSSFFTDSRSLHALNQSPDAADDVDPDIARAHWRKWIGGKNSVLLLALRSNALAGFAAGRLDDGGKFLLDKPCRVCRIGSICVVGDNDLGQGVGRRLMKAIERWALASGATDVRLNVRPSDASAIRLCQSLGYDLRCHCHWSTGQALRGGKGTARGKARLQAIWNAAAVLSLA